MGLTVTVLRLDQSDPEVAVVTLDRPGVRNALGTSTWPALLSCLRELEHEPIRALVLTGSDGIFSSGGDLRDEGREDGGVLQSGTTGRLSAAHETFDALAAAAFPVIAAVEGQAVGIGWSLALACDLVVAADDAVFSAPFLSRGVVPDGGLWWRLVRTLGPHAAAEIVYSGRPVSAVEARDAGLVTHLADSQSAGDVAHRTARDLLRYPADTVSLTKRLIRRAETLTRQDAVDLELVTAALNTTGGAPAEGRSAFLEKRSPSFAAVPENVGGGL